MSTIHEQLLRLRKDRGHPAEKLNELIDLVILMEEERKNIAVGVPKDLGRGDPPTPIPNYR